MADKINQNLIKNLSYFFKNKTVRKNKLTLSNELLHYFINQGIVSKDKGSYFMNVSYKFIILKYSDLIKVHESKKELMYTESISLLTMIMDEDCEKISFLHYTPNKGVVKIKKRKAEILTSDKLMKPNDISAKVSVKRLSNLINGEVNLGSASVGEVVKFGYYIWNKLEKEGDNEVHESYSWIYAPTLKYEIKVFLPYNMKIESINMERYMYVNDNIVVRAPILRSYSLNQSNNHFEIVMQYVDYGIYGVSYSFHTNKDHSNELK
ncbi:hypothetical protein BFU36_13145 [Sulfolobus sp. A20]|uniref:hypothetical protein n=1 Tax=Sulfolobaceae TaxID=118883 RepID=UPI0008461C4D|nr:MULTISPECIES: hypothetical protein [unclassified Sulfolobus]TRM76211.1 hypothetical protein DJ523_01495 [Sulfolobus sp. E5]TRM82495.1 hypothetical protein DJ524_00410 [Sulfolobus sp. D5]TRM82937.1 hypothetical protein DJ531_07685 [Sulfolobus sp. A20-N-F6]TRM87445.1 hypothetical protein DJ521_03590 [Sulfolobus sp. E3]TRM88199.1 hypothetical protein DJ529_05995 [Sulfolobus sp. C3]TRM94617.1 hypothetical protein DJ526_02080 [Sulfolobus sp. A20-N-G8]TRN02659.1 hypothetical protein DJ527_03255